MAIGVARHNKTVAHKFLCMSKDYGRTKPIVLFAEMIVLEYHMFEPFGDFSTSS